MCVAV